MTPEEIQKTLEQMLAVQRELQESQLKQQDGFNRLEDALNRLAENSQRQERILDRLIGYSLTNESEHLDLEEKLNALESRVRRIENGN